MERAIREPNSRPPVLPQHEGLIRASAIDDDVARERGYRSVTSHEEVQALGFSVAQCRVPALLVPIHGVNGGIVSHQIRPDMPRTDGRGRTIKYETPRGSSMALDVHPRVRPRLGDPAQELWITEGARKADSGISLGLCVIALLGVWNWRGKNGQGGLTALGDWESIALNGRQVFVVFDSDAMTKRPVFAALERLRSFLESRGARISIVYLPEGPGGAKVGLDDYIAAGHFADDLRRLASRELRAASSFPRAETSTPRLILTPMSDIEPRPVEWLWPGMIPLGKLTILGGYGGVGKSTLALDIAARVTRGGSLPDGSQAPLGSVIVVAAEDDAADTVRPRLDAAGADIDKVHLIASVQEGDDHRPFGLPDDALLLSEALMCHPDTRLMIVDTVADVLLGVNEHSNAEVRAALQPLVRLAADSGIAVLLIAHNRKSGGVAAQHRTLGSVAFGAMARTVLQVWKRRDVAGEVLLTNAKSNLAAMTSRSFRYRIGGEPPRLEWLGEVEVDAEEAMRQADEEPNECSGARTVAEDFLREALASGPRSTKEVEADAARRGIKLRTLRRAREELGLLSKPSGVGGRWMMELPHSAAGGATSPMQADGQVGQDCPETGPVPH